jgi:hypothetical protein
MKVNSTSLDIAVLRILKSSFEVGIFDYPSDGNYFTNVTTLAHKDIS